jgi:hypothetical protein
MRAGSDAGLFFGHGSWTSYVLASSLGPIAVFFVWQPLGGAVWEVTNSTARTAP